MLLRYRIPMLSLAVGLLVVAATAWAEPKVAPEVDGLPGPPPFQEVLIGTPLSPTTVCTLGETRAPAWIVNYLLPPDDGYYTLIRPSDCAACSGPGGVLLTTAHLLLEFRTVCSQPVNVRIVGATGDPLCREPDPNNVLCANMAYTLTPPATGVFNFSLALPAACCITTDAFLVIEFPTGGPGCSTNATRPRLVTADGCNLCTSYNIYPPAGNDDLCSIVGFPGNPWMNVDADCCQNTPAIPQSWGSLKTLYR